MVVGIAVVADLAVVVVGIAVVVGVTVVVVDLAVVVGVTVVVGMAVVVDVGAYNRAYNNCASVWVERV